MINPNEREGSTHPMDEEIWQRIEGLIEKQKYQMRDVLESFPLYARRINIARFLVRYELYKMVQDIPGCVFECGVYRGAGIMTWAKIIELLSPGDRMKKVIGFDNFRGFTRLDAKDGKPNPKRSKVVGGWNPSEFYGELKEHIDIFTKDSYVPRALRIQLVEGDIQETGPKFLEENPGIRISLLNLDMDIYEPTLAALQNFYPYVVKGGVVILDEYGVEAWGGEAKAFEEYFADKKMPVLKKIPIYSLPGAYFIKD